MKSTKEIVNEIERRIEYYEEREQIAGSENKPIKVEVIRARAALKVLRSLKKWIEKE